MLRRKIVLIAASAAYALTLAACGGGGGDGDTGTSLSAAYEKVGQGMTYSQVRDIVGYEYNAGRQEVSDEITYQWKAGEGTQKPEILSVRTTSGKVTGKIYVTPGRNESKFW